jgi:hypothetical protein
MFACRRLAFCLDDPDVSVMFLLSVGLPRPFSFWFSFCVCGHVWKYPSQLAYLVSV